MRRRILRDMDASLPPFETCLRAVTARDPRWDGRFFTGVISTGIYCRPICPARTPKPENIRFFASAAGAEEAGFRACLRCRPETAPELGAWRGTSNTVSRALALIEQGALDGGDVEALATRLGVGERHLRRLFRKHLGAAPVSVAQTRRVLMAKQLIHDSDLPMAEVALASGFGSVRRFNETFQRLYGRPPGALRRRRIGERSADAPIVLSLAMREPYDWPAMLAALDARGETVGDDVWRRAFAGPEATGEVVVSRSGPGRLEARFQIDHLGGLPGVLARVRRVLDLATDPEAIAADLSRDPILAPVVAARPGLRVIEDWQDTDIPASDRMPNNASAALIVHAEVWRPWRGYALAFLAAADIDPLTLFSETRHDRAA